MKDITGYEGLYAVTSCGKVYSYRSEKFLKPKKTRQGYLAVQLSKNSKYKEFTIHRLVAEAYIDNPNNLPVVNHKNEDKTKNYVGNLEWCTSEYNNSYGIHTTLNNSVYCVELDKTFDSVNQAAKAFNLYRNSIISVCKGRSKTAAGYHWKYV